jgi:hypothetical protein
MLDHDTDSYSKISQAFVDGEPVGNLTRDHILDNVMLSAPSARGAFPNPVPSKDRVLRHRRDIWPRARSA